MTSLAFIKKSPDGRSCGKSYTVREIEKQKWRERQRGRERGSGRGREPDEGKV
jgi:hypothetical protein